VDYLTRKQATAHVRKRGLPCGSTRLAQLAVEGKGPQFRYVGKYPLYTESDPEDWIETQLSAPVRSTRSKPTVLQPELTVPRQRKGVKATTRKRAALPTQYELNIANK
jgi:hypothetical protein